MKRFRRYIVVGSTAVCLGAAVPAGAGALTCPPDSVKVGNVCIDTYEASVWQIPPSNIALVKLVQAGKATLANLTAGGATQLGVPSPNCNGSEYPYNFPSDGNWTPAGSNPPSPGVYAVSIPGVQPAACVSWFQANLACRFSGKRLLRNDEWQAAAQGTPTPGTDNQTTDCNVGLGGLGDHAVNAGSRSSCQSTLGVFDMVGNVEEWVADWADRADSCTSWTTSAWPIPGGDLSCLGGPGGGGSNSLPGAFIRGGSFLGGAHAGVFQVDARHEPSLWSYFNIGFRCAR